MHFMSERMMEIPYKTKKWWSQLFSINMTYYESEFNKKWSSYRPFFPHPIQLDMMDQEIDKEESCFQFFGKWKLASLGWLQWNAAITSVLFHENVDISWILS